MAKSKGPQFVRFFAPVVEVLKELGGSGRPAEVIALVVKKLKIPDEELEETLESGMSRINNQVHWARFYLAKSGFIDSSQRGVWSLTDKGMKAELGAEDALRYFKEVQAQFRVERDRASQEPDELDDQSEEEFTDFVDYRTELLTVLKSLPPEGFERICQRLLRESGFEQVLVTGRSGDGVSTGTAFFRLIRSLVSRPFSKAKGTKVRFLPPRFAILGVQ